VQSEILEKNPDADLTVLAIWFNVLPGDSRESWSADLFRDQRVEELWDEERAVGRWFAEDPELADRGLTGTGVMWDTYLLFGADARWVDRPSPLAGAGATIVRKRHQLAEELRMLLVDEPVLTEP